MNLDCSASLSSASVVRVSEGRRVRWLALFVFVIAFFSGLPTDLSAQTKQEKAALDKANRRLEAALGPKFIPQLEAGIKAGDGDVLKQLIDQSQKSVVAAYGEKSVENALLVLTSCMWGVVEGVSDESRQQIEDSIDVFRKNLGVNNVIVAGGYKMLAMSELFDGKLEESQRAAEAALKIYETIAGKDSEEVASTLDTLATISRSKGDLEEASKNLERAAAIMQKTGKSESETAASILQSQAALLEDSGKFASAEAARLKALDLLRNMFGEKDLRYGAAELGAGSFYLRLGDYEKSERMLRRARASYSKLFGERSKADAAILKQLTSLYVCKKQLPEALDAAQQAWELSKELHGERSQEVAVTLGGLAWVENEKGNSANSRQFVEEGLRIAGEINAPPSVRAQLLLISGQAARKIGDYNKAMQDHSAALVLMESHHGAQSDQLETLANLAHSTYLSGDLNEARLLISRASAISQRNLQDVLQMDERARLSWQREMGWDLNLSCLRPEQIGQLLLRTKGVVLISILEDRALVTGANANEDARKEYEELRHLKKEVTRLMFDNEETRARRNLSDLTERVSDLEKSLGSRSNSLGRIRKTADITLDAVIPALAKGTVLLDFARFEDPKLPEGQRACYGCVILTENGTPQFVKLEEALEIDRAIIELRSALIAGDNESCQKSVSVLRDKLWSPIAANLPADTMRLVIGPDAELNFCPFAALQDGNGNFLAEKFNICYVGSGRDLSRQSKKSADRTLLVFGDPIFDALRDPDAAATEDLAMRSVEADAFGHIELPPLPGTRTESEELLKAAAGAGWEATSFFAENATEEKLKASGAPGILHLATHGFYLGPSSKVALADSRGMTVNQADSPEVVRVESEPMDPMRASGLALTGAQQTLKLWGEKRAPDPETDGILTAEEVACLDLNGTWLVTLSACETGVGEARSGEGVFGLRRAFMMAGAENLLMTLWPVADDTTASIMADFYKEALATGDAPGSLAKVQRDWLIKLREEKDLATAIREAGPFAMVMMTAPTHPPVELPPIANLEPKPQHASELPTQSADESTAEKKSGWWPF